jgi:Xaa-Pro aminopeptidase
MYSSPARRRLLKQVKTWNEEIGLLDISQHVARQRMVKQPEEIAAIQGAIDVTAQGVKMLRRNLKRGLYEYEYELEADLSRHFRKVGLRGHAFDPVIASGMRACTMHNNGNEGKLSSDELVLFDVGAEYDHYAADLARTVSISGSPSRRQQAVHEVVLEVQAYAISLLKPGMLFNEYEEAVEQFMGEKLRELGLIKTIEHGVVRKFYPHATSHFLGLNAHDAGLYDRPMEAGMVLAVEPGIYIPAESIGVRVEDDVLITPEGNTMLSSRLGRELA